MPTRGSRSVKVRRIFQQFDGGGDGGLNREEMAALVVAVNPRVKFSDEQIKAILDEVFRTYAEYIDGDKGLTFEGLLRTYDDGAGDVDRDFDALAVDLKSDGKPYISMESDASSSSIADDSITEAQKSRKSAAVATPPNHGIVFDDTWKLVENLEILVKNLKSKHGKDGNSDAHSDPGWSRELNLSSEITEQKKVFWDESGREYTNFVSDLAGLRRTADGSRSIEEAFDGHMAIGRVLYDHFLFKEALASFKRACELKPVDVRAHFRTGNCLYVLGKHKAAKGQFWLALEAAETSGHQWSYLLPQLYVNLGIILEAEGMTLGACEYYREAAILCPTHFRALKLLGGALLGVGEYKAAVKALEEAILMKPDYADAHCDLGSALHAVGEDERAVEVFQKAIDLKPSHVDALYNLGGVYMDLGRFIRASEMFTRVLTVWPNHWRAQLNKAVSLLGNGEVEEAKKCLKQALKMTNRVELHDALCHLKKQHKKKKKKKKKMKGNAGAACGEEDFVIVEPERFNTFGERTTMRQVLGQALPIRALQRITRLNQCDVYFLKKEMSENEVPISYIGDHAHKTVRKPKVEETVRRLLNFLKPDIFQGAFKAINERILNALDKSGSNKVDLCMFYAVIAPVCSGPVEKRKQFAYDALLLRPTNEECTDITKPEAVEYFRTLRAVYLPSQGEGDMLQVQSSTDSSRVSFDEFQVMFDDLNSGFEIISTLMKLETEDRKRHGNHTCCVCRYPIIGSRFKETKAGFSLCSVCYGEGKIPPRFKQDQYNFKEYSSETNAMKDKCKCFCIIPRKHKR